MIASGCLLTIINLLVENDCLNAQIMKMLNEMTFIDIVCI